MKLPLSWLREWVDIPVGRAGTGAPPDAVGLRGRRRWSPRRRLSPAWWSPRSSRVAPHPAGRQAAVCQVARRQRRAAADRLRRRQCARRASKAPLATVGAKLPGDVQIKAAKLRGVESAGMLCSAKELGLAATSHEGILELPADAPVGADLREYLELDDSDPRTEGLRRIAAMRMSVLGVAREVAALTGGRLKAPQLERAARPRRRSAPDARRSAAAPRRACSRAVSRASTISGTTPPWLRNGCAAPGCARISPGGRRHQLRAARARPAHACL